VAEMSSKFLGVIHSWKCLGMRLMFLWHGLIGEKLVISYPQITSE